MAARFAVATGNWTGAIWAATAGGAAGSAAVPTNVDDVTINKNVTVTVNATTCVALTLTLSNGTTGADVGAIIQFSTTANSKLTLERAITTTGVTTGSYMSSFNMDVSASITYTAELVINNARSTTLANYQCLIRGNYKLKGFHKKRHTTITSAMSASATSCVVADATGWQVGDRLVFASTQVRSNTIGNGCDVVTIGTITPGTGTTATITWTGGTTYSHDDACPVGNYSSNCRVLGNTVGDNGVMNFNGDTNQLSIDSEVDNVEFYGIKSQGATGDGVLSVTVRSDRHKNFSNNAFYLYGNLAFYLTYHHVESTRRFNVFYSTDASSRVMYCVNLAKTNGCGIDEDYASFASQYGIIVGYPRQDQYRHKISGCVNAGAGIISGALSNQSNLIEVHDCDFWNNYYPPSAFDNAIKYFNCRFDSKVFASASTFQGSLGAYSGATVTATDCEFPVSLTVDGISSLQSSSALLINRDADAAVQELYTIHSETVPAIKRNTATVNRSTSSLEFTLNSTVAQEYSFDVLAKAGETIKLLCFVQIGSTYDDAAYTYPSVTVSGLGIAPASDSATAASVGAWESLEVNATNNGSADGNLTVTLSAQSATANAKAYFAGLPAAPFVTRCRHYGYLFNETSPTRTVDTLSSANEATAAAYTGMAITWGASSSTAITASNTFQKLYDYHQAQACLNVGSAVAMTGAGAAGSPSLFAAGNVTISDGAVLNGSGSISMGAHTLSTEFASGTNYTYTGGAWSQLATVPTFAGGQLNLGAAGTYTFTMSSAIISMTPTAPGTYALGAGTFSGTIDLRNTTAHAITVEVPSGVTTTTANNTGGTITVTSPQIYQSVTVTNVIAGSRVQIYDTTNNVELLNSTATATWTDGTPASGARDIRVRITKVSGATAYEMIEAAIGTCGTTEQSNAISYLANQTLDTTYNTNAIDGSTVTNITINDTTNKVVMAIPGGSATWPEIYAYQVYWLNTSTGIQDDFAFINAPDTANYLLSGYLINNNSSPSVPLVITGGYGRDATTGASVDLVDTTGGTLIFAPDHVVAFSTGSGLTAGQDANLSAIKSKTDSLGFTVAGMVDANVQYMNDAAVLGNGTSGNKWRG